MSSIPSRGVALWRVLEMGWLLAVTFIVGVILGWLSFILLVIYVMTIDK